MVTHIIRGNECILFPLSLSTTLEMDVTEAAAVKQGWQLWWTSMTIKTYKVRESRTTTLVSPSQWFPLCNHPHPHCPSAHLEPAYQYFSRQSEILRFCQSELMFKCHMTSRYPVSLSFSKVKILTFYADFQPSTNDGGPCSNLRTRGLILAVCQCNI